LLALMLIVFSQLSSNRRQRAEQAIHLVIGTCSEKQRTARTRGTSVAEPERPQSVNPDGKSLWINARSSNKVGAVVNVDL
jgi:hypothetical protein